MGHLMNTCYLCGDVIEFVREGGRTIPLHQSGSCSGGTSYSYSCNAGVLADNDFCRKTRCPRCHAEVYFVQHNGGSVWFDDLGQPWPKHGCYDDTDSESSLRKAIIRNSNDTSVLGIVKHVVNKGNRSMELVVSCSNGETKNVHVDDVSINKQYLGSLVIIYDQEDGRKVIITLEEPTSFTLMKLHHYRWCVFRDDHITHYFPVYRKTQAEHTVANERENLANTVYLKLQKSTNLTTKTRGKLQRPSTIATWTICNKAGVAIEEFAFSEKTKAEEKLLALQKSLRERIRYDLCSFGILG